jgi:RimJ/RimL family protein N-acetyltransferase
MAAEGGGGAAPRVVLTPRLRLRPFRAADAPAYARICAKPEVMRHMPGGGEARAARAGREAPEAVARFAALWEEVGYGPWAVEDRATGALLGHAGLRLLPDLGGETEILYLLDSACWGRGLATEAAAAARDAGLGPLGLDRLVAYAAPGNRASTRVMEKIGMRFEGPARAFGLDAVRYVIP